MKEARYFYVPDATAVHELPQEEAVHAVRVLRLQGGDPIFLMDGAGMFYEAHVTLPSQKHCLYEIDRALPQTPTWHGHIHLAIAPTKMIDRMEWLLEKATEIGWDEVTMLDCAFSERHQVRTDRLEKIVVAAVKQSRKGWMPKVNGMTPFREFIRQPRKGGKFIAHCYEEIDRADLFDRLGDVPDTDDVTVLVGPEGDFSIDEVREAMAEGFESVTLGTSRLRTETAGLSAVMMAQLRKRIPAGYDR